MLQLLLLGVFLSVMLAVMAVGSGFSSRRRLAVRRALKQSRERNPKAYEGPGATCSSTIRGALSQLAFLFPDSADLRLKLVRAGYNGRTAPLTYSSLRVALLVGLPGFALIVALILAGSFAASASWVLAAITIALFVPPYVLTRRVQHRALRIKKTLPDALDLMVVCVEAGLGLDSAILKVADELTASHSDIAHEFRVVNQLINAGMPRVDALREMTERTGVAEVSALVGTLLQSERLGTPIARSLRLHADQLRTKRRQRAEEASAKAPIKMLIPMVLFVLPALFIVVLGPAIIVLSRIFSGMAQ